MDTLIYGWRLIQIEQLNENLFLFVCLRDEIDSFSLFNKGTIRKPLRMLGPWFFTYFPFFMSSTAEETTNLVFCAFSCVSKKKELNILRFAIVADNNDW